MTIYYNIDIKHPKKHLIDIQLTIDEPLKKEQVFWLPDWIPGSYLIRDFSKNIVSITAKSNGEDVELVKVGKSSWKVSNDVQSLNIEYTVYAWDLSVRSAHFDEQHCFFNGTSIFLGIKGKENLNHHVSLNPTMHSKANHWSVATSLNANKVDEAGFGQYVSKSYVDLIDHPFEIADLQIVEFDCFGVPHKMVFTEAPQNIDLNRIATDVKSICEYECQYFADQKPPFDSYLFMTFVMKNGFGGLEHLSSTALHCSFADLPLIGDNPKIKTKDYQKFLSLCCHEYFHSWNVKRIKPEKFKALALQSEINTELLWFFEGVTSYIDELFLVRAKVISATDYLELLAKTISRYYKGKGRLNQSLTDSSFDAWTKFYQQDENAANAITSYYVKGALVAFLLDFKLRQMSENEFSLDDLMRLMWKKYGKTNLGVREKDIQIACAELFQNEKGKVEQIKLFFQYHLYSTNELELDSVFHLLGINFQLLAESKQLDAGGYSTIIKEDTKEKSSLSITHKQNSLGAEIKSVLNDGAGSECGLSNKDIIIAVNDIRVTSSDLDATIQKQAIGSETKISYFRRDRLYQTQCILKPSDKNTCYLSLINGEDITQQNQLFLDWINH